MQLRRCLNIILLSEELDALFIDIDTDRSGFCDGVEFMRYFFKLGYSEKSETKLATLLARDKEVAEHSELQRHHQER